MKISTFLYISIETGNEDSSLMRKFSLMSLQQLWLQYVLVNVLTKFYVFGFCESTVGRGTKKQTVKCIIT